MAHLDADDPLAAVLKKDHFGIIRELIFAYVKHLRSVDLKDVPPEHSRDLLTPLLNIVSCFRTTSTSSPASILSS